MWGKICGMKNVPGNTPTGRHRLAKNGGGAACSERWFNSKNQRLSDMFQLRSESAFGNSSDRSRTRRDLLMKLKSWLTTVEDDEEKLKHLPQEGKARKKIFCRYFLRSRRGARYCGLKISFCWCCNMPWSVAKTTNEKLEFILRKCKVIVNVTSQVCCQACEKTVTSKQHQTSPVRSECYPKGYATASLLSQINYQ